jgi:hypothetical protein
MANVIAFILRWQIGTTYENMYDEKPYERFRRAAHDEGSLCMTPPRGQREGGQKRDDADASILWPSQKHASAKEAMGSDHARRRQVSSRHLWPRCPADVGRCIGRAGFGTCEGCPAAFSVSGPTSAWTFVPAKRARGRGTHPDDASSVQLGLWRTLGRFTVGGNNRPGRTHTCTQGADR